METKGLIRRVDDAGKISLGKEIQETLNIKEGTKLEIGILNGNKILLSKYSEIASLKEYSDAISSAISVSIEHDVLISDMEKILSSSKKKYINKFLSEEVQELIYKKDIIVKKKDNGSEMLNFFEGGQNEFCCQLIVPIINDSDAIGAIIILANENKCFDDGSVNICKAFAKFLSDQIP